MISAWRVDDRWHRVLDALRSNAEWWQAWRDPTVGVDDIKLYESVRNSVLWCRLIGDEDDPVEVVTLAGASGWMPAPRVWALQRLIRETCPGAFILELGGRT